MKIFEITVFLGFNVDIPRFFCIYTDEYKWYRFLFQKKEFQAYSIIWCKWCVPTHFFILVDWIKCSCMIVYVFLIVLKKPEKIESLILAV